jgi:DNA-binding beta-propeller fold protein YncE
MTVLRKKEKGKRNRAALILLVTTFLGGVSLAAQLRIPEIPFDSAPDVLKGLPDDVYIGEAVGVATNSQGHLFVFTRTGSPQLTLGTERHMIRGNGGARLLEFDRNGKYLREIGQGTYGFSFAHNVRVDAQDNIWAVDNGSNTITKFNPQGQIVMILGRRPENIPVPGMEPARSGAPPPAPTGAGVRGDQFDRPTDVAFDKEGNIFVADGYGNSRVAKFDRNGRFVTSWGTRGTAPGQFNTLHSIATDAQGNVYVADRANRRIQVFDNTGTFKTQFINVGAPWAICITPGPHQYLYSSNSNGTREFDKDGEIYKMELDGRIVGKFGRAGRLMKEFSSVHEIDCRNENELYVGEITSWRVQKLALRPTQAK